MQARYLVTMWLGIRVLGAEQPQPLVATEETYQWNLSAISCEAKYGRRHDNKLKMYTRGRRPYSCRYGYELAP